ncbi:STT3 domain-containing protein [Thermococcus waiotapuensis]|uniref:dolichyl-phosphooligosaccharide-protein glycotransferase n=1 Tax=Thermococcus waiotapuensis TaxID=90909 RepID=A0AAE4NX81_9EURY|nr:STT3 domain-containing protein [Thermococcus waiotapuensis]MDV3104355.1 STT3 domain-containing protein [Thermococcus waiotapuensis]
MKEVADMVKNVDKKKNKPTKKPPEPESLKKLAGVYPKLKTYGIAVAVLIIAYYGYLIRMKTAKLNYFVDPDTFYHFEIFQEAVKHGIPSYFAYADPPTGIKLGGSLGLYVIPAKVYNLMFSHLGYSELDFFKMWTPLVGAITIIGIYLLGRKLHSDWAGFWAAVFLAFSYSNYSKTYSGNARGEAPFLMFFVFAVLAMAYYLDEGADWKDLRKAWKKILWGVLFIVFSWLFMMSWDGSQFGLGVLIAFMGLHPVILFTFGRINELRKFAYEFYPLMLIVLLGALPMTGIPLIGYRPFIVFALEVYLAIVALTAVMLFGEKAGLNYSDKKHRFGTVIGVGLLGFIAAYAYFGRDLWKFLAGAYQSNPLYQTVAELAGTNWGYVKDVFSIHYVNGAGQDGMLYIFSLIGFLILLSRMGWKLHRGDITSYKEVFLATYYAAATYFLWSAVRFSFQASGAVMLLAGLLLGEVITLVEKMKETLGTKAMYAVVLALLLLPLPVIGAKDMGKMAGDMTAGEQVPQSWQDTLLWMRNNTNPLDSATSWWDYGYWIESSLLSQRRASTDGGHAYDRRYILAKFFSHSGNDGEVDFEAWGLNYLIAWQSDIFKFNAISYLGGAITYGEYENNPMFMPVGAQYGSTIGFDNTTGTYYVAVSYNGGILQYVPEIIVDLSTGSVYQNKQPNVPYVLYVYPGEGILAYDKIAFSNFVQLAFNYVDPRNITDSLKLWANFKLVKSTGDVNTYNFTPFGVYRMDVLVNGTASNGTWVPIYTSFMGKGRLEIPEGNTTVPLLGNHTFRVYISAFGRDVENGTLVFEAYNNGTLVSREILARNLYINHLNETPITVNIDVPNATNYRLVLIQEGPVGVLNGPVKVNGKEVSPSFPIAPGESGDMELTAAFKEDYSNVTLALRASIVYYLTPNGKDIYKDNFYLDPYQEIITYIPVKSGMSVKAGDNVIKAHVSVPGDVFSAYIEKLKEEYGDNFVVYSERLEPVFITEKEYVVWEGVN